MYLFMAVTIGGENKSILCIESYICYGKYEFLVNMRKPNLFT